MFLDKEALRWRTPLLSAAGRGSCIVLSALTPRTLFPEQPDRNWPVLVASASTALTLHGCSVVLAPSSAVLCACDTCLRGDTLSLNAEVMEQDLSDAGLAIRIRICSRSCFHADKEVPLLLAHYLSGMTHMCCAPQSQAKCGTLVGAPSPWQLPGVRPGAEIAILHAHPVVREGVLLALGASSRTTLRVRCAACIRSLSCLFSVNLNPGRSRRDVRYLCLCCTLKLHGCCFRVPSMLHFPARSTFSRCMGVA